MHIFISHSSADAAIAKEMCTFIENNNSTCFIAPRDIRSGKEYAEEIINGINAADTMVLIMTEKANKSPHVLREVERAVSRSIPILVYKLEDVELTKSMEYFLMTHQWISSDKKSDYSEILDFIRGYKNNGVSEKGADNTGISNNAGCIDNIESNSDSNNLKKKETISHKKIIALGMLGVLVIALIISIYIFKFNTPSIPEYNLGEKVVFGSYNGEPIEWRVLKISDDGKEAVLISSDIITMKAYDAAEGGKFNSLNGEDYWSKDTSADYDYDLQIQVRGNNDWSTSNIRTWLNSESEIVTYDDQAPLSQAMSEGYNGYHTEAGFLNGFTVEELNALVETTLSTPGNILAGEKVIATTDRVFLLSKEELQWFEDAQMSLWAAPTDTAIEQDASNWYDIEVSTYGTKEYYWWLREPVENSASQCYMVTNGYTLETLTQANVGTEGFGIRPAICVDLSSECFKK